MKALKENSTIIAIIIGILIVIALTFTLVSEKAGIITTVVLGLIVSLYYAYKKANDNDTIIIQGDEEEITE